MTCIVGLVDEGKVYIGADSCVSSGYVEQVLAFKKVFRHGSFLNGESQ